MSNIKSRKKIKPTAIEILRAEKLKNLRIKLNLSLEDVATKIGVSRVTISRYENTDITNIPMDTIEKLSSLYKTTPAYIMGWEETQPIEPHVYFVDTSVLTADELVEFNKVTGVNQQLFFNDVNDDHDMAMFKQAIINLLISQRNEKKTKKG